MGQPLAASDIPVGPLGVSEVLMAEPGFGSPAQNTARKGSKAQNSKSTTERKWWIRERKTWRQVDEENGTKGKILQQWNPSVCNIFPKEKRLKGSCWGYLELSWKWHYPGWAGKKLPHGTGKFHYIFFPLISFSVKFFSPFSPLSFSLFFSQFCGFSTGRRETCSHHRFTNSVSG